MDSQINMFEYAATNLKTISVQTRLGERQVETMKIVGQCALHETVDDAGYYTITHILSGLAVIHFQPLGYDAALLTLNRLQELDLDAYWSGHRTKKFENQLKKILKDSIQAYWRSVGAPVGKD